MEPTSETLENNTESVTKERKKPNLTPEDRAKRAERMREMATKRNDLLKKQKEGAKPPLAPPQTKTPRAKREKKPAEPVKEPILEAPPQRGARGGEAPPPILEAPPLGGLRGAKPPQAKPPQKRPPRTLVIQSSSDSEDYGDSATSGTSDDDEPVIYIAKKKSKSASHDKSITKAKPRAPEPVIVQPVVPVTRVKFF
jgi:hypothetical protein